MMIKRWGLLFMLTGVLLYCTAAGAETLIIPGTGACQNLLSKLVQEYSKITPGQEIQIPPSTGSGGGIRSVLNQEATLARVARPLKTRESQLSYLPFAKDAVVFIVGKKVGINSISTDQLHDIFTGKIENWGKLGGDNRKIRILIREEGDSSLSDIRKQIPSFNGIKFSGQAKILYHEAEMVKTADKYHYAIGWAYASSLNRSHGGRVVSINGRVATSENIISGSYPIAGEYAFVFRSGELTLPARKFIDFVFSDKGSELMKTQKVVPVPRKQ